MTFLGDDEYLVESADQLVTKYFEFRPYRRTQYYIFFQRTTSNNNALSCGGAKAARVGSRIKVFARFDESQNVMRLYSSPDEADDLSIIFFRQGRTQELEVFENDTVNPPESGQDIGETAPQSIPIDAGDSE